jgi:hypothetical protein
LESLRLLNAHDARIQQIAIDANFNAIGGFGIGQSPSLTYALVLPNWFAVSLMIALAFVAWPRRNYHFRLRSLLAATTVVAVVLGLIARVTSR